ncbi:hypothetical protein [Bdellovibrio sp. KM01]|uniref:hypothetical protein n=1 Tax=Bdellovibrio sp. KM01 TaxID=2748865 RepID=UPI0015E8F354|nr:hypothetical protein [Bdellovibrio sp. KM01]QLY25133.1 hypothetical protein HW988_17205 [Bdellovibrio sp. KM01]
MKALILASAILIATTAASASNDNCKALKTELQSMRDAQSQIMNSLVSNHETFASTLEEYSDNLVVASGETSKKSITKEMKASAKAFRTRGVQGKRMSDKLQEATSDLLTRVADCL